MSRPLEDYGLIGNAVSAALVSRDGSIDWLCLPRFDSDALFCALLGDPDASHWQIVPDTPIERTSRRYLPDTAVLETTFETADGAVTLVDFMPPTDDEHYVSVMRLVRGERGRVPMRMRLVVRMGYGRTVPWLRRVHGGISLVAGPDALLLTTPVALDNRDFATVAAFDAVAGEQIPFVLGYHPSHWPSRPPEACRQRLQETVDWWQRWSDRCRFDRSPPAHWHAAVIRSLITLKALTFAPTGGIVAAPTTSLPEQLGGVRNWDYRFCWIRDATLTLYVLLDSGYLDEAAAWRMWLLRAAAGDPSQLQVMYGLHGERRLQEFELPWLAGYADSRPVRVGNAAFDQLQLDVPGELMDTLHAGRRFKLEANEDAWQFQRVLLTHLEQSWHQADEGIWEVRGGRRHFTHSRLMCWVAFDRGIKAIEDFGLDGPLGRWRRVREAIRDDICTHGWNAGLQSFVAWYGGRALDASLLLMAQLGFLAADDPRFASTVAAIERELLVDGVVLRYRPEHGQDGLPGDEGAFLACSFWLADAYLLLGRRDDAVALFEWLLALRNDLGLLAEEYDPRLRRMLGNFPQAFSHVALVNTANNLIAQGRPAADRGASDAPPA